MKKVSFDEIKNIEFPESWKENALSIPSKKNTKQVSNVRFYRLAAGIAACAVIAVAVAFSLLFGINSEVDLTDPNPESVDYSKEESVTITSGYTVESKTEPQIKSLQLYNDTQKLTLKTEPAESGNDNNQNNSNLAQKPRDNLQDVTKAANQSEIESNDKTTEMNSRNNPMHPQTTEFPEFNTFLAEETNSFSENVTEIKYLGERTYEFYTDVFNGKAKEDVYCRIEDDKGNIITSGLVTEKTPYNGKTRIKYIDFFILDFHENYSVSFYDSSKNIIKQRVIYVSEDNTYKI